MDQFLHICNVAIFVAILAGTFLHHRRSFHVRTMVTCFVLDIALLLTVELRNRAVEKSIEQMGSMKTILAVHIGFSLLTVLLWIFQIVMGVRVMKGRMDALPAHAKGARAFLLARAGNLVTAFFV